MCGFFPSKSLGGFGDGGMVVSNDPALADCVKLLRGHVGDVRHIYNQFVIRLAPRDSLMAHLKARQIGHEVYYPLSMHQQACFASLGHRTGDFPESEAAALETVAIPIYPELTEAQQQVVVDAIVAHLN